MAQAVGGTFHRIQCTPDLLPSDIVGTQVYNQVSGTFETQLGPVHANVVLLDEINRSSAKTQSAMLEAMQERQTSIGDRSYPLPDPFLVLATQNPIEQEGTYPLPEAQMDRFTLKDVLDYPSPAEEAEVLRRIDSGVFDGGLRAGRVASPTSSASRRSSRGSTSTRRSSTTSSASATSPATRATTSTPAWPPTSTTAPAPARASPSWRRPGPGRSSTAATTSSPTTSRR